MPMLHLIIILLFCSSSGYPITLTVLMLLGGDFSNFAGYRFFQVNQKNRRLPTFLVSTLYAPYHIQGKEFHWPLDRIQDLHCQVEKIIQDTASQLFWQLEEVIRLSLSLIGVFTSALGELTGPEELET